MFLLERNNWIQPLTTGRLVERSEGVMALVNPRGTSQIYSGCGAYVMKGLSVRTHHCPKRDLTLYRDVNAARNVLRGGLS